MLNIILNTATVIGILVMIFTLLIGLSVLFLWIVGRYFERQIKDKYPEDKEDVYQMYCDKEGEISWGEVRP